MECKFCGAELEEGSSVCPVCGQDNEAETKKNSVSKLIVGIVAAVALLAVLAVVVITGSDGKQPVEDPVADGTTSAAVVDATVAPDGNPDDITCKGTYTVSDEEVVKEQETVVATMGDLKLTNSLLQVYYWNLFYNSYANYVNSYGLDLSVPLDSQLSPNETTWQQSMLSMAIDNWRTDAALAKLAKENNVKLDAEAQAELDNMKADMEAQAKSNNFDSAEAMLQQSLGKGCTLEAYMEYVDLYYHAAAYYASEVEKIVVTDQDKEDFFKEYTDLFEQQGVDKNTRWVSVRHILIQPEGCTFNANRHVVADEQQWESCRAEAQKILDDWLANDGTEEGFGELAKELTADSNGSSGGLYEKVSEGQMVQTFNDWCFDEARVYGDSGLVKTEFGYHIMFFVGSEYVWDYYAGQNVLTLKKNEIYSNAANAQEMNVEYSKIVLGNVDYLEG